MAARTGASVGVAVTITILGLVSVVLFVTTMVFYGKANKALVDLEQADRDYADYVSTAQREHATVRAVLAEARAENQSVVEYLMKTRAELLQSAAGDPAMTREAFRNSFDDIEGSAGQSLMELVASKNTEIEQLNTRLETAESERSAALAAATAEAKRVADIEAAFNAAAEVLRGDVSEFGADTNRVNDAFGRIEQTYASELDRLGREHRAELADMQAEVDRVSQENITLVNTILRLRGEGGADRVTPLNEAALVDGTIDRVNAGENEVVLSIGREHKVILGMTFAVFSDSTDIRPDSNGNYAPGKAVVEVVRVEQGFSRARILVASEGNPIIRGDVVANAVYDPSKTYKFVVDGLFDTNKDGIETKYERDELAALIERWGGEVVDEITGDLDFVVLGEKPILPPPPGPGAPIAVINDYVRLQDEIRRYDMLLDSAEATSVPLLNANRLQTLIGDFPE